jgi:hypothetical protein
MYKVWGKGRDACRVLVGKSEGEKPRGRPRDRWKDIKWTFKGKMSWTGLIWPRIGRDGGVL